jgi:hypothetical protein
MSATFSQLRGRRTDLCLVVRSRTVGYATFFFVVRVLCLRTNESPRLSSSTWPAFSGCDLDRLAGRFPCQPEIQIAR